MQRLIQPMQEKNKDNLFRSKRLCTCVKESKRASKASSSRE